MTILVGTPRSLCLVPSVVPTLDHHSPLYLAVGKPIEVQKTLHPSQKEVDRLHQRYMKELENLFEAHKLKYKVPRDQHLEIC